VTTAISIRLRPLTPADGPAMFRWMQDPPVSENLGLRLEPSLERTLGWISRANTETGIFARAVEADGEHVGNAILDQWDSLLLTARFSIYLGIRRGEGLGKAATALMLDEGFGRLELQKIWLIVHAGNEPALRTYRRLGFTEEGTLREEFLLRGARVDAIRFGLLRREWMSRPSGP
jgi:[ribosomal protein S5]-alanine N-acetyltransferase